jgi:hypothetical protein
LFGRHCPFERSRPQPLLIPLTSSAPKRTTMATICPTSSRLPAASSQLLDPRKRHLPSEEIETAPSVFDVPDVAAMLLIFAHLPAPSALARPPSVMLCSPPHQIEESTRSLHCLEERPLISPSAERYAHQLRRGWQAGCSAAGMTAAVVSCMRLLDTPCSFIQRLYLSPSTLFDRNRTEIARAIHLDEV